MAKLLDGVDSLNAEPLTFHGEGSNYVTLDGGEFASLLAGVFDPSTYPKLPMVISDVAERRTDRVGGTIVAWARLLWSHSDFPWAWGMYFSVVCGELFNPPDESAYDEINADIPASLRAAFAPGWDDYIGICASWPVGDPRPELSQPVTSAVRTLVASGAMDPVRPPAWGDLVATTLSDREVVVFPASGHDPTLQSPCGTQMVLAFLADPDQSLDTCCTELLGVDYELSSAMAPWSAADQARLRFKLRHAPIRPPIRERLASRRRPR